MIRSCLAGIGLLALTAAPAIAQNTCKMPATSMHTKDAVVIDKTSSLVLMVVCPDGDAELSDPAYNAPGTSQIIVVHDPSQDQITQAIAINPAIIGPAQLQAAAQAALVACAAANDCPAPQQMPSQ